MPTENRQPTEADLTAAALFEAACQAEQDRAAGLIPNADAALWILDGTTFRPMTAAEEAELAEVLGPVAEIDAPLAGLIEQATEDGEDAAFHAGPLSSSRALLDVDDAAQEALDLLQGTLADVGSLPLDAAQQQVYLHSFTAAYLAAVEEEEEDAALDDVPPSLRGLYSDEDPSGLEPFDYATDR